MFDAGIIWCRWSAILAHLRAKEQAAPTLPLLMPPTRAPPDTLPLFAGKEPGSTPLNQEGRR